MYFLAALNCDKPQSVVCSYICCSLCAAVSVAVGASVYELLRPLDDGPIFRMLGTISDNEKTPVNLILEVIF
jgi:hypothetical protein